MDERVALRCAPSAAAGSIGDDLSTRIRAVQADQADFGALDDRYVERVYAYLRARAPEPDAARPRQSSITVKYAPGRRAAAKRRTK